MLLPLSFLPLILAHRRDTIDFTAKAESASALLKKLSAQAHVNVKAAPDLEAEILFVSVKNVTVEDLKAQIASAMQAHWVANSGEELLTRTEADRNALWQAHVAYRRKLVDIGLQAARKRLATPFDAHALAQALAVPPIPNETPELAGQRREREEALFRSGPLSRLGDRLILACNPDDLAGVGPYSRAVFRVTPTQLQATIDSARYDAATTAFTKEQQEWHDVATATTFPEGQGRMVSDPRTQINLDAQAGALNLEITRGEMSSLFMANLIKEGAAAGLDVLSQTVFADPTREFLQAQAQPQNADKNDPLVPISEMATECNQRLGAILGKSGATPLTPTFSAALASPTTNDPLSWAVSDTLTAYAKAENLNVVAALPDTAFMTTLFLQTQSPLRLHTTMKAMQDVGDLVLHRQGNWVTSAPADRYEAAIEFTPREVLSDLIKSVQAKGRLDIKDYADYAFRSKRLNRGGLGDLYLAFFDRTLLGSSDRTSWKALQLYGSFSEDERQELEKGDSFVYSGMLPDQQHIVERMLFGARIFQHTGPEIEPTTAFATGVPSSTTVSATSQRTLVVVAYAAGKDGVVRPCRSIDPYTLATVEQTLSGNPQVIAQYGLAGLVGFAVGGEKHIRLHVRVAPTVTLEADITVPDYNANATPVAWDKLPAPFADQITAAMAQIKSQQAKQPVRTAP